MRRTAKTARMILASLAPLLGTRAAGAITATATGAPVEVPLNAVLVPVIESASGSAQVSPGRPVRVSATTEIDSDGATVAVTSVLGGALQNLPVGTVLRWDPPLPGVAPTATVSSALTGGTNADPLTIPGCLKQALIGEQLTSAAADQALFKAQAGGGYPAAILFWQDSGPVERVRKGYRQRQDIWSLYVVAQRYASALERAFDGLDAKDACEAIICELGKVDGETATMEPVEILGSSEISREPSSYVYVLRFATVGVVPSSEAVSAIEAYDWDATQIDAHKPAREDVDDDEPLAVVDGSLVEMPQET